RSSRNLLLNARRVASGEPQSPPYRGSHLARSSNLARIAGCARSLARRVDRFEHYATLRKLTVQERAHSLVIELKKASFMTMKSRSKKRAPTIVNLTVKRRYLAEREVERLMDCARTAATGIARASEVCDLQWQQIELSEGRLHVHRVKNGIPSVHPIR